MSELIIGNEYQYKDPHPNIKEWRCGKLIAYTERDIVLQKEDGAFKVVQRKCTEIKPKVKEYTIDFWVNVCVGKNAGYEEDVIVLKAYNTKEAADYSCDFGRIACLHFTRTFIEGKGL